MKAIPQLGYHFIYRTYLHILFSQTHRNMIIYKKDTTSTVYECKKYLVYEKVIIE